MTAPTSDPQPPNGSFRVDQRLLRGYGPLAIFALMLLLMSVLVPSKVPAKAASSSSDSTDVGTDGGPGIVTTGPASATDTGGAGTAGSAGTTGGTQEVPGTSGSCPDRTEQVPGDPYSPPCVAFSGSNGGATAEGVTAKEIVVTFRVLNERGFQQTLAELAGASLSDSPDSINRTVAALADYFNQRFQLYGRKIKIQFYDGRGSNTNELLGKGREQAVADAIQVADEFHAFADLSATSEPYAGALADRGVIGFGTPYLSRAWHEKRAPFAWSLATDGSLVSEFAAEYAVQKLYDGKADHAGGNLKGKPRVFGTLAPENSWYQESVKNAEAVVRKAGKEPGYSRDYVLDLGTMSDQATRIIADFKSRGITTILCGCDPIIPVFLSGVANREQYYPEFIIVGTALTDADIVGQLWNQNFASHAFGVSPLESFLPPTQTIAYAAYKSVRKDEPAFSVDLIYYQMYMLAIGLQMAGPNLTPQTFEAGMFAYPPKSGPVGLWKFGVGDRTAANDVREIYWDANAISTYNSKKGAYIGANNGARYQRGQIPKAPPSRPTNVGLT
ncbi:MAG: ABC transporter substrate-binding protein [Microthrixaceae bacterium]